MSTKASPFQRNRLIRDSIGTAIYDAMKDDPAIHLFGEGAAVKQHYDAPLIERDFADRVHTMPIAEDGIVNFAVGASLLGVKPVCDLITADFLFRAFDSIANTAAKLNIVLPDSEPRRTIVIRAEFLMGGPTTGQRPEMLFARIPGLNIVVPSTPRDAYDLMRTALVTPGVTLFFEDRMVRDDCTKPADLAEGWAFTKPLMGGYKPLEGKAIYRKQTGGLLTIVAYGLMRQEVEALLDEEGLNEIDLLDLVTLYPLNIDAILESVKLSRQVLIIEPDIQFGGIGAEIIAQLHEQLGAAFNANRLGAPRATISARPDERELYLPSRKQIFEAIRGML